MNLVETAQAIEQGHVSLGIELGSTQIKTVLVTADFQTVASGSFVWENQLVNNMWTCSLDQVWEGIRSSYAQMAANVQSKYHSPLIKIASIGVSAMMHGYLPFDKNDQALVPFRTWRNNITGEAATQLTELFDFNIPERWSIAHLDQAILNQEAHVPDIDFITTLAGYVHWQLSGEKVLGIGDASGMFPIDEATHNYSAPLLKAFAAQPAVKQYPWSIEAILPKVLTAGEPAGHLTEAGAVLLDASHKLEAGSLMAPPEGDAGTGMVGTNSVRKRTGNISVGTSAFSMVVLEQSLKAVHRDIDLVTTPSGAAVAMVHINNCSSDINAWAGLFKEFADRLGMDVPANKLYETLFLTTTKADPNAGGLMNYAYVSGENITKMPEGRPLFVRQADSQLTLGNFMQTQLYSAFAPLKIGMDILINEENIQMDAMIAQGGLFKTAVIGQQILANTLNVPITVTNTASEGGPWGMAVLAAYAKQVEQGSQLNLADFLDQMVFANPDSMTLSPEPAGVAGYQQFIETYKQALPVERTAVETMKE